MRALLQQHHHALVAQHDAAQPDLAALRDTVRDDVLPQLALPDRDAAWLAEWLSDTASMFRLLRRHRFRRSAVLQEIRAMSIWRLYILRPVLLLPPIPTLCHCLPPPIADPFGRPLVFLKLASLQSFPCSVKDALLQEVERLRLHLRYIRDHHPHSGSVPLQYIVLVDLAGASIQTRNLDLCSWLLSDVISRFPGMLAAVFVLNYSWMHSGAWSVAKRLLPSSVIARVFFPSKTQLLSYCSAATLPAEYGGSLPTLDHIDDALRSAYQSHHLPPPPSPPSPSSPSSSPSPPLNADLPIASKRLDEHPPSPHRVPSTIALPPLSPRNPFYGYPAIVSAGSPHTVRHVRRGVRELVRTLAVLWWRRWKRWVWWWTWTGVCAAAAVVLVQRRRPRTRLANVGVVGVNVKDVVRVMVGVVRARR